MAVLFDQTTFLANYPEFVATVAIYPTCAQVGFNRACTILNNTDSSPVPEDKRADMLYALSAHIVAMFFGVNGQKPSGLVGRVSSAHEGSVSVSADMGSVTQDRAWYYQTQYGAMYWTMARAYRSALYIAPPVTASPTIIQEG